MKTDKKKLLHKKKLNFVHDICINMQVVNNTNVDKFVNKLS